MSQNRIVTLIDMDCFYCQVEVRADPSLKGKPVAVVQYNQWKGGGIIAVNYEARSNGVTRGMRGDEAVKKCPDIKLVSVPEVRGKADLTRYRDAGREVVAVLCEFSTCVEKASIDEAYIDLTDVVNNDKQKVTSKKLENTHVVGYDSQNGTEQWLNDIYNGGMSDINVQNLARAAVLVEEIRSAIVAKTSFHCSAGISHNKILAKLACGLHKPNRQTVLPPSSVPILYKNLPLKKIRNLGGKLGDAVCEQLGVTKMGEVIKFSLKELQQKFGDKSGLWLYNIARGIDSEVVKPRLISKSIGCCKNFKGPDALTTKKDVKNWLSELAAEIVDRIQDDLVVNKRKATVLVISAHQETPDSSPFSRSIPLSNYDQEEIVRHSLTVLNKCNNAVADSPCWLPALKFLGLSAGKFIEMKDSGQSLLTFFKPVSKNKSNITETESQPITDTNNTTKQLKAINVCEIVKNDSVNTKNEEKEKFEMFTISENTRINLEDETDSEFNNLKIGDYHNSFFCKYFAHKRLRLTSTADDRTESNIMEINADVHVSKDGKNCTMESSTASTSKCERELFLVIPSTSRQTDLYSEIQVDELSKIDEKSMDSIETENYYSNTSDLTETCTECNQKIKLVEFLEHLDHHVACKLQEELNSNSSYRANIVTDEFKTRNDLVSGSKPKKRLGGEKRKYNKSKTRSSPAKRPLQITRFFKPQIGSTSND